jgi:flavin-dependent dehydrogenase
MDFDAVVVGAGPAGCMAARDLAFGGWSVGLFDTATGDQLGRSVVVDVEQRIFRRLGLALPSRDEIPYSARAVRILTPARKSAFTIRRELPTVGLYLDRFVKKLCAEAQGAGVTYFGGYRATRALSDNERVTGVSFVHQGHEQHVQARLVIDATGFDAALVRGLDPTLGMGFVDDSSDVVLAATFLHEIEPDAAAAAVAAELCGDEEAWTTMGPFGTYSTELAYVSLRKGRAYGLLGCKADWDGPPLSSLLEQHKRKRGYFARCLHHGEGRIRVCRSLDRLVASGLMVVGEAACMVNPLTGSGVASALHSGYLAAIVGAEALSHRAPTAPDLWRYAARYQRRRGATLAAFDVARRMLEDLTPAQICALLEARLIGPGDLFAIWTNRLPPLSPRALLRRTWGLARHPTLVPALSKLVAVSAAVYSHYRSYPESWDPERFLAWRQRARRLFARVQ